MARSRREALWEALAKADTEAKAADMVVTFERVLREHGFWVAPWEPTEAMVKAAADAIDPPGPGNEIGRWAWEAARDASESEP